MPVRLSTPTRPGSPRLSEPSAAETPSVELEAAVGLQNLRDRDVVVHQAERGAVLRRGIVEEFICRKPPAPGMNCGIRRPARDVVREVIE